MKERTHDYLRGTKCSHYKVLKAIEHIHNLPVKPTISINCIISDINLDEIVPLANWAINNEKISGIIFQAIVQPYETPLDDEWYKRAMFSELWPKNGHKKVEYIIDQLIKLKMKVDDKITNSVAQLTSFKEYFHNPLKLIQKKSCPMDSSSLLVNWGGRVYFCGQLQPMGNIKELPLEEILISQLVEDRWNEMRACRRNCNSKVNCFFKEEK